MHSKCVEGGEGEGGRERASKRRNHPLQEYLQKLSTNLVVVTVYRSEGWEGVCVRWSVGVWECDIV